MGANLLADAVESRDEGSGERRSRDRNAYNNFDEFMAHIEGTLGKDHPIYKAYKEAHIKDRLKRISDG